MNFSLNDHPRPKHLLIDLDGTLIQSGSLWTHVQFTRHALPHLRQSQPSGTLGDSWKSWIQAWKNLRQSYETLRFDPDSNPVADPKGKSNFERMSQVLEINLKLTSAEAQQLLLKTLNAAYPSIRSHFQPLLGASDFLEWAKSRFTMTLATNPVWPKALVEDRMRWGAIDPTVFQSITTFDRMHSCKPRPSYYKEILMLENKLPQDCLHIGNELKMDLPATLADIPVFIVNAKMTELTELRPELLLDSAALAKHSKNKNAGKTPGLARAWTGTFQHLIKMLS
jgi:FMN phosphatase YigB (HAD superfamily)